MAKTSILRTPRSANATISTSDRDLDRPVTARSPATPTGSDLNWQLLSFAALAVGLVLFWFSARSLDLYAMSDIGIASVLPLWMWVSYGLILASFLLAIRSRSERAAVASVLGTIVALNGLAVIAQPTMRFAVAWRHVGIVDHIATNGSIDPNIDAYFNWPGFFALGAIFREATGISNIVPYVAWAQVANSVLYLPPLIVISRAVHGDRRVAWTAVWLFYVCNWIGQDYYSPQGWALFNYLMVLAIILSAFQFASREQMPGWVRTTEQSLTAAFRWLRLPSDPLPQNSRTFTVSQSVALFGLLLLLVVATITGHQLTPYAMILVAGALTLASWSRLTHLPILIGLGALFWLSYMTTAWLTEGFSSLNEEIGSVLNIFGENVGDRVVGSQEHQTVVQVRMLATVSLWLLAGIGVLVRIRNGQPWRGLVAAAGATFLLLGLQSYGGEVLLRIALFSLPLMAMLAASVFTQSHAVRLNRRVTLGLAVTGAIMLAAFPITKYGNERKDWYSLDELAAVRTVERIAPPSSVIAAASNALPWRSQLYAVNDYRVLTGTEVSPSEISTARSLPNDDVSIDLGNTDAKLVLDQVKSRMQREPGQKAYLILTRAQEATLDMFSPWAAGSVTRLGQILRTSPEFTVILESPDATVFSFNGPPR